MAQDLNSCTFVGRLTRDSEIRYSQSNLAIVRFSLAINRRKQVNGQWQDVASFLDFSWMGSAAEKTSQYLTRGRQVAVQSEALTSSYEDRSGQKRTRVEFSVRSLQLLAGSASEDRPQPPEPETGHSRAYEKATAPGTDYSIGPEAFDDDEVPF